jgi:signal peptidase I
MPDQPSPYAPPAANAGAIADSGSQAASPDERALPKASPSIAALLSLLLPGLGHVYARQTRRGMWWLATLLVGLLVLGASVRIGPKAFVLVLAIVVFDAAGIRLATVIDAAWAVRRRPGPRAPAPRVLLAAFLILAVIEMNTLGVRRFIVEAFKIPSGSMIPTLLVGDHIFIDKLRSPTRGDLIVFPFPEHPNQDFVKRIVGLPGDRLRFRNGHPVVNDVEVPSCYVGRASYAEPDSPMASHEGKVYLEKLGDRAHLAFYDDSFVGFQEEQGPYVVKDGEVFVIGDNRHNAHDSRMWWGGRGGGVPLATVRGIPFVVWMSANENGVDWSRFGLALDGAHLPASMASLQPALDKCLAR